MTEEPRRLKREWRPGSALPGDPADGDWVSLGHGADHREMLASAAAELAARRIALDPADRTGTGVLGVTGTDITISQYCSRRYDDTGGYEAIGTCVLSIRRTALDRAPRLVEGVVREWFPNAGWGVVDSPDTPGGCLVRADRIRQPGYRWLEPGWRVDLAYEAAEQDGFRFRALTVLPMPMTGPS